jgi:putative aminopeptidase FrvX
MTVPCDRQVLALLKKAGDNVGIDLKIGKVELGATDAAAFTQAGFKSVCLGGMDHNLKPYYHTRLDTCDNLGPDALAAALDIALEAVQLYDESGLPPAI